MRKFEPFVGALALAAGVIALTGCEPKPGANVSAAPASAASPAEPAKPSFAIFAAQIGSEVDAKGLLTTPKAEVNAADPLYGLAVFRGNGPAQSRVAMKVTNSSGTEVFSEEKPFTPTGDVPVMFTAKAPDAPAWSAGDYKATFVCDGAPCWEIPFKVK